MTRERRRRAGLHFSECVHAAAVAHNFVERLARLQITNEATAVAPDPPVHCMRQSNLPHFMLSQQRMHVDSNAVVQRLLIVPLRELLRNRFRLQRHLCIVESASCSATACLQHAARNHFKANTMRITILILYSHMAAMSAASTSDVAIAKCTDLLADVGFCGQHVSVAQRSIHAPRRQVDHGQGCIREVGAR